MRSIIVAALALVTLAALAVSSVAEPPRAPAPPRVAVVDLQLALDSVTEGKRAIG